MTREQFRNGAILVYLVGNAMTYNHIIKANRELIHQTGELAPIMLKTLAISCMWPIYWAYRLIVG